MPSYHARKYLNRRRKKTSLATPMIMVAWMFIVFFGAMYTNPKLFWEFGRIHRESSGLPTTPTPGTTRGLRPTVKPDLSSLTKTDGGSLPLDSAVDKSSSGSRYNDDQAGAIDPPPNSLDDDERRNIPPMG
mmetsp:Transcript_26336/g.36758  ORF Transcript_26336/g.36758 Transcript_26336/m.36758 type:complete len:131 (-) Transcript_26336:177-569(-)|eukprot:CAMPEP_0185252526 /NCGR_PEP_ID=MMETSP1359-20130426/1585_1 /TAXON_ID=552665 /ORGANISM="Bigelowiella longifila, Strain CCMP242" /LENGTH=130 /DNA_ID=CAMNT_0027834705 /DNA_START=135 /DNA_END=527 /DNA_ORIENTATION=-